jgi:hypothetical protein
MRIWLGACNLLVVIALRGAYFRRADLAQLI